MFINLQFRTSVLPWSDGCCSVAKSRLTICDFVDCNKPGFTVLYYLPEFAETHVYWVTDAIQTSYPLLPLPPLALISFTVSESFPMSQLFPSGDQSIGASVSASVLPMNIQNWFPLGLAGLISLQSKGLSQESSTTVQKHQFFRAQLTLWLNSHIYTWLLEKP